VGQPAGLDVVEGTVRRELDAQERRVDAADSHARLVMATAGVFVTLADGGWLPLLLTSRLMAGLAALAAMVALAPSTRAAFDARVLGGYLDADPADVRLELLAGDIRASDRLEARLTVKVARLRLASRLIMASVAFATLAAIVDGVT